MKNNLCLCVKFCCKLGKNFTETFQLQDPIVAVDGERVSSTKKHHGWVGQRSRCCCLCFLIGKALSIMIVTRGQTVNKQLYQDVLLRLRDAVRRKRPELWESQTWMLHHDNAPAHATILIRSYLAKDQTSVVPHLPYSPDLALADFFLFPKLKTTLKWRRFQTTEEIKKNATRELRAIT